MKSRWHWFFPIVKCLEVSMMVFGVRKHSAIMPWNNIKTEVGMPQCVCACCQQEHSLCCSPLDALGLMAILPLRRYRQSSNKPKNSSKICIGCFKDILNIVNVYFMVHCSILLLQTYCWSKQSLNVCKAKPTLMYAAVLGRDWSTGDTFVHKLR